MSEEYSGFDLTMYNLFTLLREMYYTRGETETNFLLKSGGTITGSVTIQGNLVVNGQSYSIDTENLKVGDYTITLAKDNEQTLTSMVGMVVPKYDGTNYGFFGWDADGYAYVGDLTNYDGTSAITLANNSSLQRISTIDTTNTVVASNGVIYVYDATNHCFKKPTNDNKYYVIRNGAFVETELFTEQKSKNIDNSLYNLGAFDTYSVSNGVVSVVRKTWKVILNEEDISVADLNAYSGACSQMVLTNSLFTTDVNFVSNVLIRDTSWNSTNLHAKANNGQLYFNIPTQTSNDNAIAYAKGLNIEIEVELSTSYTESIIENQPLLNIDQNGCNFLREEWEKGLNLFNKDDVILHCGLADNGGLDYQYTDYFVPNYIPVKPNTKYTYIGATSSFACYDSNYNFISLIGNIGTLTTPSNCYYVRFNALISLIDTLMVVEADHPYPYQEYNGAIVREGNTPTQTKILEQNVSATTSFQPLVSFTINKTCYVEAKVLYYDSPAASVGIANNNTGNPALYAKTDGGTDWGWGEVCCSTILQAGTYYVFGSIASNGTTQVKVFTWDIH